MRPTRRQDLVTREIDGEVVILDHTSGNIHQLNATASWIWTFCDGSKSPARIAELLAGTGDTPASVLDDVQATLADFERLGLLMKVSQP